MDPSRIPLLNTDCSICLDELSLTNKEDDQVVLACAHVFHKKCMLEWSLTKSCSNGVTCPLCRRTVAPVRSEKSMVSWLTSYFLRKLCFSGPDTEDHYD